MEIGGGQRVCDETFHRRADGTRRPPIVNRQSPIVNL